MKTKFDESEIPAKVGWMGDVELVVTFLSIVSTAVYVWEYVVTSDSFYLLPATSMGICSIVYLIMWDRKKTIYEGKSEELVNCAMQELYIGGYYVADGVAQLRNGGKSRFLSIKTEDKWEIWGIEDRTSIKSIEIRNYK